METRATTVKSREAGQQVWWVHALATLVRSLAQPGVEGDAGQQALLSFREVLKQGAKNFLLFGNGLVLQFGYRTRTRDICYRMAMRNWRHWLLYLRSLMGVIEFERLLLNKSTRRRIEIKHDFALALIEIMGEAELNLPAAAKFLNEFDEVFTLNYDTFTARLRSLRYGETFSEIGHSAWNAILLKVSYLNASCEYHGADASLTPTSGDGEASGNDDKGRTTESEIDAGIEFNRWFNGFFMIASRYVWEETELQDFSNLHGSFDFFMISGGTLLCKYEELNSTTVHRYLRQLREEGGEMQFVLAPDSAPKVDFINQHDYFKACINRLQNIAGNLFIYGVDFRKLTDEHIWQAIRENVNIANIYIAVSPDDQTYREDIKLLLPDYEKVHFFDWTIR